MSSSRNESTRLDRRNFLGILGVGGAAALMPGCATIFDRAASARPNIVLVVADDPGYNDFGYKAEGKICETPQIDTISENGTRFTNAYTTCFLCSPSRAGIMTGRYQQRFGYEFNPSHRRVAADNFGLATDQITMANVLKDAGYATGYVGKWHLGFTPEKHPLSRGFDEFFGFLGGGQDYFDREKDPWDPILRGREPVDEEEYTTYAYTREAVDFIDRHAGKKQPFFLYVSYNAVHSPWQAPDAEYETVDPISDEERERLAELNAPLIKAGRATIDNLVKNRRYMEAMVKALDDGVGGMLDELKNEGVYDNTLFIFVGDNGGTRNTSNAPLNGFKGSLLEGGIRVPMAMQWPGRIPEGKAIHGLTSAMDIFPTAAAAADARVPADRPMDGVNLMPYMKGQKEGPPHDTLYWRYGDNMAIRKGDWKLIMTGPPERRGKVLFNLAEDIGETRNLYPAEEARADRLEAELEAWSASMMEPLWSNYAHEEVARRRAAGRKWQRSPDNIFERLDDF